MVHTGPMLIDLAKPSHLVWQPLVTEAIGRLAFQLLSKSAGNRQIATSGVPAAAKPRVLEFRVSHALGSAKERTSRMSPP
jgi:hypothetical protein